MAATAASCGDDQHPWCDDLQSLGELDELAGAIAGRDGPSARDQLERFQQTAADAPEEIRDEMSEIAAVLAESVEVSLAGEETENLELRREDTNERLAEIPTQLSAVSSWAEEECGIRLD